MQSIIQLLKKHRQFILFCIVGAGNTLITMAVLWLLDTQLKVDYRIASSIGYMTGVIHGYLWSTFLVFKQKKTASNALKFILVNLLVLGVNTGLMHVWVEYLGLSNVAGLGKLPAQALTICFTMVLNFILNKFWTFQDSRPHKASNPTD